jgi:hypothetical protein
LTVIPFAVLPLWALACLGIRVRLHGRLLVAGRPLRTSDWVWRALSARWLPRVALGLLIVQGVREPSVVGHFLRGFGWRDVLVLVVAGVFRLFSTATLWAEFRAVEVNRMHRMDLRPSLIWEVVFWAHIGLTLLSSALRS